MFGLWYGVLYYLLSLVIAQRDGFEIAIDNCLSSEGGSCIDKSEAAARMRSNVLNACSGKWACVRENKRSRAVGLYSPGFPMIAGIVVIRKCSRWALFNIKSVPKPLLLVLYPS